MEQNKKNEAEKEEEVVYTDGDFLDIMKGIEREVLAEIDPAALQRFDEEDRGSSKGR